VAANVRLLMQSQAALWYRSARFWCWST